MRERNPWTPEEDKALVYLREQKKVKKWSMIAKIMEIQYGLPVRKGKQCRERYLNHLDSSINPNEEWSKQQEDILITMHSQNGNRWTLMAKYLPGRTQNCIKNHFYSKLRKAVRTLNRNLHESRSFMGQQIENSLLSKIVEVAEDKFRPGKSFENKLSLPCANLIKKLYFYEEKIEQNPKDDGLTKQIVQQAFQLDKLFQGQQKIKKGQTNFLQVKKPSRDARSVSAISIDSDISESTLKQEINSSLLAVQIDDESNDSLYHSDKGVQSTKTADMQSHKKSKPKLFPLVIKPRVRATVTTIIPQQMCQIIKVESPSTWDLRLERVSDLSKGIYSESEGKDQKQQSDFIRVIPPVQRLQQSGCMEEESPAIFKGKSPTFNFFESPKLNIFPPVSESVSPDDYIKSRNKMEVQK